MRQSLFTLPTLKLDGTGLNIGIIVARYNWPITSSMLALTHEELICLQVTAEHIHIIGVPGAYELAVIAQKVLRNTSFDALICLGCVMKGATRHDVLVGDAAAQGIQRVALDTGIPIVFGVICAEDQHQAEERIIRGKECARTAIEMAQLVSQLSTKKD